MELFWKIIALILVSVFIGVFLQKQQKDTALLLTLAVCSMTAYTAIEFFRPVISFLENLKGIGKLDNELFTILIKAVGIGIISEISCAICSDSGHSALGKTLQILSGVVILWLSLPLLDQVMELLQRILEGL